jgi:hypothetical protein
MKVTKIIPALPTDTLIVLTFFPFQLELTVKSRKLIHHYLLISDITPIQNEIDKL